MGNDQRSNGSSSTSSSKKNKSKSSTSNNSNNIEKPKQPQRGLGVAQLEKIRLHNQMANFHFFPQPRPCFPSPFPTPLFPHVQEDMRIPSGYQGGLLQSSSTTPIGFGPPSTSSSSYAYHHPNNSMMGVGEHMERTCNIRFGESHPSMTTRLDHNNNVTTAPENHQFFRPQGLVTRHLLSHVEVNNDSVNLLKVNGSSNQNSESSPETEELDLDLKLSL